MLQLIGVWKLAKQSKLDYAVLYASEDGAKLYNAMGFKVSKKLYEYSFAADFNIFENSSSVEL